MPILNTKKTFLFGLVLLITALLTLALGITSIAIHKWSQAGAAATFSGAVLIFTGALAIHVSKRSSRLRVCLLLGSTVIACLSTVVMLCVCALSIRKDCEDRDLVFKNPLATEHSKTMATCIVVVDVLILVVGLIDLIPSLFLAYTCWTAMEQMAKISSLMVLEPVEKTQPNGHPDLATMENGAIHDADTIHCHDNNHKGMFVKSNYCNNCSDNFSGSVLALHVDAFDNPQKVKEPKEKKEKKKKKEKKLSIQPEELEAAESINIAVANHDLDHMEPTIETEETINVESAPPNTPDSAEKLKHEETVETPNYDLPDSSAENPNENPRELYTTDDDITRYNPVYNPVTDDVTVKDDVTVQESVPEVEAVPEVEPKLAEPEIVQPEVAVAAESVPEVTPEPIEPPEPVEEPVAEAEIIPPEEADRQSLNSMRSVSFATTPTVIDDNAVEYIEDEPENTETPVTTEPVPDITESPEVTQPEIIETPVVTPVTEITETPVPEIMETPEVTPAPEITETPEVTPVPEITETPEVTPVPEITETPETQPIEIDDTPKPEPTEVPTLAEPQNQNIEPPTDLNPDKTSDSDKLETPAADTVVPDENADDIANKLDELQNGNNNNGTVNLSDTPETGTGSKPCGLG